ncbi:uncharacterized protein K452DRAFT_296416 [Aplosporella prunicola CBS 121167]|uniref:Inactive metallocarboxypeptidase ECM14 n=1 Tax=Aplosporella prunicola CBS 121167 TaxID=1176127 RepID=A0A6A6BJ70_9PEZI|nr:uncharacterized protein K452DRAFT_296416 [Aplosporella prunicola CBS 121167]KAF2144192.1 hypothetical protein K452DRAFT_296416 [Aplosporella prunicola CBS 121167]
MRLSLSTACSSCLLLLLLPAAPVTAALDSRPSWRRLSDRIIQAAWGHHYAPQPARAGRFPPPGKMLARYGDDMVLRFNISTEHEALKLAEAADTLFLDVWEFNANWVDIRVAKDVVPSFIGLLPASLHDAHVPVMQGHDLAQAVYDSYPTTDEPFSHSLHPSQNADTQTNLFFRDYQPFSVMLPWLRLMESLFSSHVRYVNIGMSYEGRDIPALRVGVHPKNNEKGDAPRKTIIVSGGVHAREWISTTTVNYLAYSMITSYGKDVSTTSLLEAFDWVFIPTLNPDGYVYSWENDRLWRKNRQKTSLRFCQGIDLDRSFDFHWDGESTKANPCSETFAGDEPFEGVEAKRFAEWAKNQTQDNNVEFVGFLDLHSYSQQVLYPYSFSCHEEPPTLENLEEVALGLAKAIRISKGGYVYTADSACRGNVVASENNKEDKVYLPRFENGGGSALDWFYHEIGIKNSYQIKLRDTGSYGFLLPKQHIVPTGKEVLDALTYLGHTLLGDTGFELDLGAEDEAYHVPMGEKVYGQEASEEDPTGVDNEVGSHYANDNMEWELRRRRR